MANKTISGIVQNKIDTSANFTANNPILASGQFGVESDTNKIKMGNGTSAWNDLEYISGDNNNIDIKYSELLCSVEDGSGASVTLTTPIYYTKNINFNTLQNYMSNYGSSEVEDTESNLNQILYQLLFLANAPQSNSNSDYTLYDKLINIYVMISLYAALDNDDSFKNSFISYFRSLSDADDLVLSSSTEFDFVEISYQNNPDRILTVGGISINLIKFKADQGYIINGTDTGVYLNGVSLYIKTPISYIFIQWFENMSTTLPDADLSDYMRVFSLPSTIDNVMTEYVTTTQMQSFSEEEKAQARTNIGAGTSSFSGSYNDLTDKPDISPNLYDLIITSQTEFESFCSSINNSTCTAASVLFVGDGGNLEFTKSDGTGIQLPTTLKIISGINNAIINLGSISTNGLYYETRPTSDDYSINNITIKCSSSTAGNDTVISNCINLTNVTALSIGAVATLCPSAFKNCYYLNYCIANGAAMSAYDNCRYLHDCRGTSTGSYASSDTYSFCTYLDGCYGDSNASTYYYCTNLVGCRSNSGYRGFYNCKQVKSCSSTASYRSYVDCYNLYDCEANRSSSTSTTWYGFENCDRNVFPHFPFGGTQIDINKLFTGTVNNTIFIDNYDNLYKFYDSTGTQQTIASLNDIPEVPSLTNYVTTNTTQTITAVKYFDGLIHFLGETNNLDNITSQNRGITISSFAGGISTAPTTDSSGIVINYYVSNTYRTQLVLMNDEQASTWRRSYINGNWTAWKQISGNSVDIGSCTLSYSSTNSALEFNFD